jgi:hypothetical protein
VSLTLPTLAVLYLACSLFFIGENMAQDSDFSGFLKPLVVMWSLYALKDSLIR